MGVLANLRSALQRRKPAEQPADSCSHVALLTAGVRRGSDGCEACIALGDSWVHLRMCMTCGRVGCCDSSPNRHASRHAGDPGHEIARSLEPGENWMWCFADELLFELPE